MAYHYPSCDLLVGAAGNEVYRLNLEQGRFLNPIATDSESGVNATELCPAHQLFGFGTASGTVEFWDPRSRSRVGLLQPQVPAAFGSTDATSLEVSALKFRHDGLSCMTYVQVCHGSSKITNMDFLSRASIGMTVSLQVHLKVPERSLYLIVRLLKFGIV
jgi:hypothetical protein